MATNYDKYLKTPIVEETDNEIETMIKDKNYSALFNKAIQNYQTKQRQKAILEQTYNPNHVLSIDGGANNGVNTYVEQEQNNSSVAQQTPSYAKSTRKNEWDDSARANERESNYQAYLDANKNAYIDSQISNKYFGNQLRASGLANSGEGAYLMNENNNNNINLMQENYRNYLNQEQTLTQQAIADTKSILANLIGQATSEETINKHLQTYGLIDENGNYTSKFNQLSDSDKAYFETLKQNQLETINNDMSQYMTSGAMDLDTVKKMAIYKNGQIDPNRTVESALSNESKVMQYRTTDSDGTMYMLQGENYGDETAYFIKINGSYYQITPEQYNDANYQGKKVHIRGSKTISE